MSTNNKGYKIHTEQVGYSPVMYIVSFFNGWLGTTNTYKEAETIALNHVLNRK